MAEFEHEPVAHDHEDSPPARAIAEAHRPGTGGVPAAIGHRAAVRATSAAKAAPPVLDRTHRATSNRG